MGKREEDMEGGKLQQLKISFCNLQQLQTHILQPATIIL